MPRLPRCAVPGTPDRDSWQAEIQDAKSLLHEALTKLENAR